MTRKCWTNLAVVVFVCSWQVPASGALVPVPLNLTADEASVFFEYASGATARINLRDPSPNEFRQRLHLISDESVFFGALDVFPNDSAMHFGELQYDDSTLLSGTGVATIAGLTFGVRTDPLNPTYENWRRFTLSTAVNSYSGTVALINNTITSINMTVSLELQGSALGSPTSGIWPGTFTITGKQFDLFVSGSPLLNTFFNPAPNPPTAFAMDWHFFGTADVVESVPEPGTVGLAAVAIPIGLMVGWMKRRRRSCPQ